ncbi:hypothetical protein [Halorussus sp. AFM4]|uniref:hypothetical protein n=1 Tax=Halorussus sp. AFM4 TaxID=3421651 RepID=UPI003EBBE0DF
MTGSTNDWLPDALADESWWNSAVGRTIRTIWHFVGLYAAVSLPLQRITAVLTVGFTPAIGSIPVPTAAAFTLAAGLAILLSALRPGVSSARTLALGFGSALSFQVLLTITGHSEPVLSGRPAVAVDIALAAVGALALSAVFALSLDTEGLATDEVSES